MPVLDGEILSGGAGDGNSSRADGADEAKVRSGFWSVFGKAAGRIPFAEELAAAYYCAFDPDTPTRVRTVLIGALAYFVFPFDTIPDVLALVGFSDDVAILTVALSTIRGHIREEHRIAARAALQRMRAGATPWEAR
ncbi:YkvA family protein [Pseudohoeflea coraliihabitans]|uniref:DUF1232 domain-containing protein n=1 Tax=Pseudohoeflea coraliihabitans TaxID=2860393 RepID=A0ABS6WLA8_9HYPH|nr:YkvA family protein [Pseudohoeflea sp. DP4N28-3]MBW3096743.1 DUF1232 domain-containing protein [Pseudohoeflea sp. DP4N28-3]